MKRIGKLIGTIIVIVVSAMVEIQLEILLANKWPQVISTLLQ